MDILLAKSAFGQWLVSEQECKCDVFKFWSGEYVPTPVRWFGEL